MSPALCGLLTLLPAKAAAKKLDAPVTLLKTESFGAHVLDELKAWINEPLPGTTGADWDDEEDEEDDDDGDDDEDMSVGEMTLLGLLQAEIQAAPASQPETGREAVKHGFPKIAAARNNLTVLSQRYNLYFAAYQDSIYVYQPQRAGPKILPPPSVILRPPPSSQACYVTGNIDRQFSHQINSITVGNLGDLEIVLFAYDDGDVAAYYTHAIVRWIKTKGGHVRSPSGLHTRPLGHPKPMFHENVGSSAWGLAVHEKSRLIAISSNLHQVTVFATRDVKGWGVMALPDSSFKLTDSVRESLGVPGNEIISGPRAKDGRTWLNTTCGLYYVKELSPRPDAVIEQHQGRSLVRHQIDYKKTHASRRPCLEEDLSDEWETDSESDYGFVNGAPALSTNEWSAKTPYTNQRNKTFNDLNDKVQFGRMILPHFGETLAPKGGLIDQQMRLQIVQRSADWEHRTKGIDYPTSNVAAQLPKNLCILRTSRCSIQLEPVDPSATGVFCKWLLSTHSHVSNTTTTTTTPTPQPWDLHPIYSERVSMLLHVPELNLVVAGSPTGRVALITLTKTAKRLNSVPVRHGFRVERVLPRKEEDDKRLRPTCTLSGVAIAPAPCGPPGEGLELRRGYGRRGGGGGSENVEADFAL
ncbi:hypothetical protein N0V88_006445 [Collariella sp. IMI 366227]|nr:hypothetical protein N0V88_006445 [Collariella sp. IMI 366227]